MVLCDPLDGSSNIDVNVSIGMVFSIHRKITDGERGTLTDCLQPGSHQLAAGYVVYDSSTMMVYTTGAGVHGFTLDPSIGELLLSHLNLRIPEPPVKVYSINEAYYDRWPRGQQRLVSHLKCEAGFGSRYVGSLVADVHRTLLQGGSSCTRQTEQIPKESSGSSTRRPRWPSSWSRRAGSDGRGRLLDVVPGSLTSAPRPTWVRPASWSSPRDSWWRMRKTEKPRFSEAFRGSVTLSKLLLCNHLDNVRSWHRSCP